MATAKPMKKKVDGCIVALVAMVAAIFVLPFLAKFALDWPRGYWSIAAHTYVDQPVALIVTLDDGRRQTLRFEGVHGYRYEPLYQNRSDGTMLISAQVLQGDRERTTVLNHRIRAGTKTSLAVAADLTVTVSDDMDHHM